jgi:hypothetical protein
VLQTYQNVLDELLLNTIGSDLDGGELAKIRNELEGALAGAKLKVRVFI